MILQNGTGEHGLTIRLRGHEQGLHDVARNLRALDRAWTFAASAWAYQRGHEQTWENQTQYIPRPSGLSIVKESPTVVQLWEAADVPALVLGSLAVMRYCVEHVEKITTVPTRIRIARSSARIQQLQLEYELAMLEVGDEDILLPTHLASTEGRSGTEHDAEDYVVVDRETEIERIRAALDELADKVYEDELREEQARHLEDRARSVKRDLERAEPEIVESWGLPEWTPKRIRRRK